MGEFAEMALNGVVCERCGEFLDGIETGYPRMCFSCGEQFEKEQEKYKRRKENERA